MPKYEGPAADSPGYAIRDKGLMPFIPVVLSQPYDPAGLTLAGTRPNTGRAWALVDTGANITIIHPNAVRALELPATGTLKSKAQHGLIAGRRIRVGIVVVTDEMNTDNMTFLDALEHEYASAHDAQIVLGANWLDDRHLVYDGPRRHFTISW